MSQGLRSTPIFNQSAKVGCYGVDRATERKPVDRLVGPVVAEGQGQADQVVRREPVIPIRIKRLLQENDGWQEIVRLFAVHDLNGNAGELQSVEADPRSESRRGCSSRAALRSRSRRSVPASADTGAVLDGGDVWSSHRSIETN
jgi:hypothetical protein